MQTAQLYMLVVHSTYISSPSVLLHALPKAHFTLEQARIADICTLYIDLTDLHVDLDLASTLHVVLARILSCTAVHPTATCILISTVAVRPQPLGTSPP